MKINQVLLNQLTILAKQLEGDLFTDIITRTCYATDASIYKVIPLAVARPKNNEDIKKIIAFCHTHNTSLIPRAAGTSLAGQVVGSGIVCDVSKYMNHIKELNTTEKWIRIEPGVVLDELNKYLAPHGLFFGPETATANRCMLGGMVGNNSCGAHSIIYGSTRDHLLAVKAILSDGSEVEFKNISATEFNAKCNLNTLEGAIYRNCKEILSDSKNCNELIKEYPHPTLRRRNTGYAIDQLINTDPFKQNGVPFNFCKILAGSEGTLAFITEITLNLVPLPPKEKALLCVHFNSVDEALRANLIALKYNPGAVELMDNIILSCAAKNKLQQQNSFFVKNNPEAILIIEFARNTKIEVDELCLKLIDDLKQHGFGYHYPIISGDDIKKVWELRKSGLGALSNLPGDAKTISVIEDTAVPVEVLPEYIAELHNMLKRYGLESAHHAHVGSGELHIRPLLNLKTEQGRKLTETITLETVKLVKKYNGAFCGEHGLGRLRAGYLPFLIGNNNYELLKKIKFTWDEKNIFNPGKIINAPPMMYDIRYVEKNKNNLTNTYFDFSETLDYYRAIEKCNGSADCRKTSIIGGTMCPTFMANRDEWASTRGRANVLREFFSNSSKNLILTEQEVYDVLNLCLSCKACKTECPSNVDMTKLKAEFLQHYYKKHRIPIRTKLIGNIVLINKIASKIPTVANFFFTNKTISTIIKTFLGFTTQRPLQKVSKQTLTSWFKHNYAKLKPKTIKKTIYLFVDEFTNYNDTQVGIKAVKLLSILGYEIRLAPCLQSARPFLSKGMLKKTKQIANKNIATLQKLISPQTPLIGIEPSAILSFRDEYISLANSEYIDSAKSISVNTYMFDEFICNEYEIGNIDTKLFSTDKKHILLHGHCHQKALSSTGFSKKMISIPINYTVDEIPSGCCGMAGSFGYEKEHYELSIKIGEMVLFPAVRNASPNTIIAAPGTSCRQQIKHGTGRDTFHPIEILYDALILK